MIDSSEHSEDCRHPHHDVKVSYNEVGVVHVDVKRRVGKDDSGETSGNKLAVREILIDCDDDTLLVKAERLGGGNVCHTGERTCFNTRVEGVTIP